MSTHETIQQAVEAIHNGDRETGRQLLARILRSEPSNVQAWLWMSQVVDSDAERQDCLRRVLALDPNNQIARTRLLQRQPNPEREPPAAGPLMQPRALLAEIDPVPAHARLLGVPHANMATGSDPVSDALLTETQRKRGHRNIMLAGAMTLVMMCGLIFLVFTVTTVVPQAKEQLVPTPEPTLYMAVLSCLPCDQAGSPIVLWEKAGDGISRGAKTGELAHNTTVSVLAEEWSQPENRAYVKVAADGQAGWVPATFVKK